ncbi:hypothetical protein SprV_0802550000 [Sparganum proliferum]
MGGSALKLASWKREHLTSMIGLAVLLIHIVSVLGSDEFNFPVKPNTDFLILQPFSQKPLSLSLGNTSVPEGTVSQPCTTGTSCWQALSDRQFAIILVGSASGPGIIYASPLDKDKSFSAIIIKNTNEDSTDLLLPNDVGSIVKLELNDTAGTLILLLYAEEVGNTTADGNIRYIDEHGGSDDRHVLVIPYLAKELEGQVTILLTGHVGNSVLEYVLHFSEGKSATIRIDPMEGPPVNKLFLVPFSGSPPNSPELK